MGMERKQLGIGFGCDRCLRVVGNGIGVAGVVFVCYVIPIHCYSSLSAH